LRRRNSRPAIRSPNPTASRAGFFRLHDYTTTWSGEEIRRNVPSRCSAMKTSSMNG
jgi:hypothetical protein